MRLILGAALLAAGLSLASPAAAQGVVDEYCAQISAHDKVASDGFELTDAASILRQDRANYHKFQDADRADQGDRTFGSSGARARIPALLDNGQTEQSTLRQIVRGNPSVCVEIYPSYLYVYVN
ncbi:hypothetical protein [Aurantimonas sp. 22II-16-19i]|uniref:hypothetical protein n=1 Tax=Aurantimonas sp. 22II-16-19i TaxID=1317114 RepID=UPI0009F7C712|nr:hypothetical protein [Aurantimonas sp. 22II-16-19i]ORE98026.1 hypothetical protein ATO4_05514 [Aurantimonas sp. 22II-16-19i]